MTRQSSYRLKLANGFLDEAQQDFSLKRWRSSIDNAQLAVENATKAVLSLLGPVGRTHYPAPLLREALQQGYFPKQTAAVQQLAEIAELLGQDIHIQTDYGDEGTGRTPWELFDETDAQQALAMAETAVQLAQSILQGKSLQPDEKEYRSSEYTEE